MNARTPDSAPLIPGWSAESQAVAWFRAFMHGLRSGDARLLDLARRELRELGVEVAPVAKNGDTP